MALPFLYLMHHLPFCVQSGISRCFCVVSIEGPELKCVTMMWFFILVCTTVVLFEFELKTRLEKMIEMGLKDERVVEDLVVWRDHHALVCQLVTCINHSFGIVLAIVFSNGCVTFIADFYRFIRSFQIDFLFIFIQQALFLSIFIIASYRLQSCVFNSKIKSLTFIFYIIIVTYRVIIYWNVCLS